MAVRVSPTEASPTHDVSFRDKNGREVGFRMVDAAGNGKWMFVRTPVERTALKTTSGNSQYADLQYPYSPVVQDDWSGGRGLLDFERDGTRFYDSFRARTGRANQAFLGPQEQYSTGVRSQEQAVPGNVVFKPLTSDYSNIARRFVAGSNYTAALVWLLARRRGAPLSLGISIMADNAGVPGVLLSTIYVSATRLPDTLSEWLDETINQALTLGTAYWINVSKTGLVGYPDDNEANHWEVGASPGAGSTYTSSNGVTWTAADFDLYYRLTDATVEKVARFVEFKERMYAFMSSPVMFLECYANGDRGAADSNAGQLSKLIDATKAGVWTANQWAGCVVKILDGPGKLERQTWRKIVSNTATELVVDDPWVIEHTTATEYVILGSNTWYPLGTLGLTQPVTDLLVSPTNILYVCQGANTKVRRLRSFNDAGTYRDIDDAANCEANEATAQADFMTYKVQAKKIVLCSNADVNGDVSIAFMTNTSVPAWGTDLTWDATPTVIGSRYEEATRLEIYPDDNGNEAVWVGKGSRPWIVPTTGNPYPLPIKEMDAVKAERNFYTSLVHNVYLYFPLGDGVERYYRGQMDDIGVNLGEGLPHSREGPMLYFAGYPGSVFGAVDAGPAGYSSVSRRDGNGWHEHYRAPLGQRIRGMRFQPIPGQSLDRLWLYVGNDFLWLPFPSGGVNELNDPNMLYTHEAMIELARMHAGMFDVVKVMRTMKLWSNQLAPDVCWLEADVRVDEEIVYTPIEARFQNSPQAEVDLIDAYGLLGKRLQFRIRLYTTDAHKTPVLLAVILETVMRIAVKNMYSLSLGLSDRARCRDKSYDDIASAFEKLALLDNWVSEGEGGMLLMHAISPLYDGKLVFLNPVQVNQVRVKRPRNRRGRHVLVVTTSAQEA